MRKSTFLIIFLLCLPHVLSARTLKDERRLEEEARQSLHDTETAPSLEGEPAQESAPSQELAYFQALLTKKYALLSDALRPLLILLGDKESFSKDQATQVGLLGERGILPERIASAFLPDEPLRKGLAAQMFCRALGIKGGLGLRLFGMSQRYAMRELVFEGIMPEGSAEDFISGEEFIIIFSNAAQYLSEKNESRHKETK
jgi:hypothetical protein